MQTANERREEIRNYLSDVRFTTLQNLVDRFHVSKSTIRRDIDILTETTPLYMTPGNGGGIHAIDGWYASSRYLSAEQEALLRRLSDGLQPEDEKLMDGILAAFAKPRA